MMVITESRRRQWYEADWAAVQKDRDTKSLSLVERFLRRRYGECAKCIVVLGEAMELSLPSKAYRAYLQFWCEGVWYHADVLLPDPSPRSALVELLPILEGFQPEHRRYDWGEE